MTGEAGTVARDTPRVQGAILQVTEGDSVRSISVDSPAWFAWLADATVFSFIGEHGHFTARQEATGHGRGGRYWKAYRRRDGRLKRFYLGRSAEITLERLTLAAAELANPTHSTTPGILDDPTPGPPLRHRDAARRPRGGQVRSESPTAGSPARPPLYLTSFVGREPEIARITQLLATARLVTLTGPGGVGKTRLALQVAATIQNEFAGGALFVSLASIADPALVPATIAQAVGVKNVVGRSIAESLNEELRGKTLLLVLDNFEQVAAAAPILSGLLAAGSSLKALVTSRAVLHVSGEHEFSVAPLGLPDRREAPTARHVSSSEAVSLFVARAQAARHDFALDDGNAPAVAELCYRLDGLPLAIELAAARLRTLPLPALLDRLDRPLPLLTGGPRDVPARQQTLRNTITWSYDLLDPAEQVLFRRLAVFRGATFDGIEAICFPSGAGPGSASVTLPAITIDALDSISSLVEKHLLRQEELPDGQPWYTMLETIREYALERLAESGEADTVRRRHALHYLTLAEAAEQEWLGSRQSAWLTRLKHEHDNLRAALQWCVERGYAEPAFRMAVALWWFWARHWYLAEGCARLSQLLARFPARGASDKLLAWRAQALRAASMLASAQGAHAAARALQEEGLGLRRRLGDPAGIYNALEGLGMIASQQGDHLTARAALEEALAIALRLDDPEIIATTLHNLGSVVYAQCEFAKAREFLENALNRFRAMDMPHHICSTLLNLSAVTRDLAEYDLARQLLLEVIDLCPRHGYRHTEALALANLGSIATAQGDYPASVGYLRASLTVQQELGDLAGIAFVLERYATLAATQAHAAQAVRLAGAAGALRELIGVPLTSAGRVQLDRALEPARHKLGPRTSDEAWTAGRALSVDEAIAEALAPVKPSLTPALTKLGAAASVLTQREREVAALIGRGQTNRQIAGELFITEGTVANHVVHMLGKLGYNSRTQVAVWAADNGLLALERSK